MEVFGVTSWNGIVSPVCDAAETVAVFGAESCVHLSLGNVGMPRKARILKENNVKVLICGAISSCAADILHRSGVAAVPWICGPVERVVEAYKAGILLNGAFTMPGCRRQMSKRGGHRNRGNGPGRGFVVRDPLKSGGNG